MAQEFNIEIKGVDRFVEALTKFTQIEVKRANRFAINKALVTIRKEGVQKIREKLNLPVNELRNKHTRLRKAIPQQSLGSMEGVVSFSDIKIPMIRFISGKKTPIDQKGVAVSSRKKLRATVIPGRKITLPHSFVMRGQVFTRTKSGLKLQRTRSVGHLVAERGIGQYLQLIGGRRYQSLFYSYIKSGFKGKGLD